VIEASFSIVAMLKISESVKIMTALLYRDSCSWFVDHSLLCDVPYALFEVQKFDIAFYFIGDVFCTIVYDK
jgi:hypothetical protein